MDAIEDEYQAGIVRGAARAAQHSNISLVCVAGGVLGDPARDARCQRNFLFDLVDREQYDGLLVLSGALGNGLGARGFATWLERFRGTPIVNLGVETPGFHSIGVDGAAGVRAVVSHLVEVHGRHRIAFVRGPETSDEAEERYAAYRAAMEENGLALDPRMVVGGTWLRESGVRAVEELFDRRGLGMKAVEAIVSANDYMALGIIEELRRRGLEVPQDVAVTGFDDVDACRSAAPPLTTVRQPVDALGREGLRRLVAMMNGADEPLASHMLAELSQRRSCGCIKARRSDPPHPPSTRRSFEVAFMERRSIIAADMTRTAHGAFFGAGTGWEERLSTALLRDLLGEESSAFAKAIDQTMGKVQRAGGDVGVCPAILSALRRAVYDCSPSDVRVLSRAEDVLDTARDLVSDWLVRAERLRTAAVLHQIREFTRMASQLMSAPAPGSVRSTFETRLRALGIPAASIGLFAEAGRVTDHCLSLVGYTGKRSLAVVDTFRSRDLGHAELRTSDEALLVQPLVFEGEPLGIATLSWGSMEDAVYEQGREILGTGAKGFVGRHEAVTGS
jgi:DNA-binding LacI/PurR family transcriptional regulator